ncbi:MAG TPA: 50S ribosomal protein L25 [Dehalococcoidia bacterium]|jgi:large subunit ribosomal protein L25|nr:50S ribosomal protein L25 [Dehalococcoidia bacterium]|tara:strand:+ start:990 stop:1631 length:642 start_codon:yes stop_codon:yes gene_type:complete
MTTASISLELSPREVLGKKVKRLRQQGVIPVHLYGPGVDPQPLQCETTKLVDVLVRAGGNTAVTVTVQGGQETHLAFAREIQWDPRRDDILHVDFLAVDASRPVSAQVPITLIGESPGARTAGGTVMQQLRDLNVEALPLEVPRELELDLTMLTEPDGVLRAADIVIPGNVTLLTDPEDVVVRIEVLRAVEEEVFAEDEGADASTESEDEPEA